jgi:predicted Zn-dependent protease
MPIQTMHHLTNIATASDKSRIKQLALKLLMLVCIVSFFTGTARAQGAPTIIRDAEIENTLARFSAPVFEAAGIGPNDVRIILVEDHNLNAFVAGGMNIFVYAGIILEAENPGELVGVMAHETGHIAGAHLIRTRAAMERASFQSLLVSLLGVAAMVGSGDGGAAGAVFGGGQSMVHNSMLSHSRTQEAAADQAAVKYLSDAGLNAQGMLTFLEKMQNQEALPSSQQAEYVRTHPLTRNRISYLRENVERHARKAAYSESWVNDFDRIKAKLIGFMYPDQGLRLPADTVANRYARTIALYRKNRLDEALQGINALIEEEPQNPYFFELKGQMLYENNHLEQAVPAYAKAVQLLEDSSLIRSRYGQVLLALAKSDAEYRAAITELERSLRAEQRSPRLHRLLATGYGRIGQEGTARLHLAEEAVLQQRFEDARRHIGLAEQDLPDNTAKRIRLQDLKTYIEILDTEAE